ncbi:MAG: hypothetical protein JWL69_4332 [Phycisphaerales bacterium]|nr:hypothetical protein [Phycisphaerales bacterium]
MTRPVLAAAVIATWFILWAIWLVRAYYKARQSASAIRGIIRRDRGLCPHCGYDLTGNVSGTCPECGEKA